MHSQELFSDGLDTILYSLCSDGRKTGGGGMFLFRARTKTGEDNARLGKKSNNIKIFKSVKDTNAW